MGVQPSYKLSNTARNAVLKNSENTVEGRASSVTNARLFNGALKIALSGLLCLNLVACNTLPKQPHTEDGAKLSELIESRYAESLSEQVNDAQFAEAITEQNRQHPNLSGYHPIITGANAFVTRSVLSDMATKSIDVQYYIWHNDQAGQLLLKKLWMAAERGVIVRFLLDDFNNNVKLDKHLRRFASHPNVAVRIVNPMSHRHIQMLNYVTDLKRINHRMHNKSMTFDRQLSIIGGRNVGDEYLSNSKNSQFADLDVLLIGDVVADITDSFESYWHSPLSFDIETLVSDNYALNAANPNATKTFISKLDQINPEKLSKTEDSLSVYDKALRNSSLGVDLINKNIPFRWANMTFLSDEVEKLVRDVNPNNHLVFQLRNLLGKPNNKLSIVSSYFVPTKNGVDTLIKLANQGIEIKILTNSFKATDVSAVHSGYAQWRPALLKAGIEIYELKATASEEDRENKLWRARSQSSTSLHAKTFAVDEHNVFIGSYNVDPRSANINTEIGVVIEDDELAAQLHKAISDDLLSRAYKVTLSDTGNLQWLTVENGQLTTYDKEPDVDFKDSFWLKIMSSLPIDWLL